MVTADRFFISGVLGASLVAYYTVPFEALIRILVVPGALTSALFPRLASMGVDNPQEAQDLYKKCLKLVAVVLLPICILIIMASQWGLGLWLGEDFSNHAWLVVCILAVGIFLNGVAHVPFAAIQASGDAKTTACLHILELVIYIPVLFILMKSLGIAGAAIAWTLRVGVDLIFLLVYKNKQMIGRELG
jgi:O-antigen/teichoic acid export membrane protein